MPKNIIYHKSISIAGIQMKFIIGGGYPLMDLCEQYWTYGIHTLIVIDIILCVRVAPG